MGGAVDVSVIVPCYNTQRYLDQALTSAEQNGSQRLEIIVLNDGSTDNSLSIMEEHARRDARIRIVDKPNEGYGATVNRGIDEARGTYVSILEPDDYVLPHTYDRMASLARDFNEPDVLKAGYWRIMTKDAHARPSYGYLRGRIRTKDRCFSLAEEPQLIQYHPSVWAALYKRSFLDECKVRFLEVSGAGWVDNPFAVRALAAARTIAYTDEAFYCYREDLGSASSARADARLMIDRWNDRQDALEELGVTDEGILRANAIVGLRFMGAILAADTSFDKDLEADLRAFARRIDPAYFKTIDCIAPHVMRQTLELAQEDAPLPAKHVYYTHLAREAWWALCQNGITFLAHNLIVARKR